MHFPTLLFHTLVFVLEPLPAMATLHVFGAPSACQSTQTLAEQGLLVGSAPVSPVSSLFSASAVTLAENDTTRDETFTVGALQKGWPAARTDEEQVTWDGPNDPENPKNWSAKQKWAVCRYPPSLPGPPALPVTAGYLTLPHAPTHYP